MGRDHTTPRQVKVDGQIYGNWEDAVLYMGDNQLLLGFIPHLHPAEDFLRAYDVWGVFRATPELTAAEQARIREVVLDLAGLHISWWEKLKNSVKRFMGIRVPPKLGSGVSQPEELIASGYEAAGRKIASVVPWKVELHHIDGSAILVRVF